MSINSNSSLTNTCIKESSTLYINSINELSFTHVHMYLCFIKPPKSVKPFIPCQTPTILM